MCVERCPVNNSILYFADPTVRWCVETCDGGINTYGNNNTQTCERECIDFESFADYIHPNRFCIQNCTNDGLDIYYRNNYTKRCTMAMGCPTNYFGDNATSDCVANCSIVNGQHTWGHIATMTCVTQCYGSLWGDNSTGLPICVSLCPSVPPRWSYDPPNLCVA
jgi:hypothetical protein